ncbi:hypothetical protein LQW54_005989 [Pestalotiopsis sp. IQ-011]
MSSLTQNPFCQPAFGQEFTNPLNAEPKHPQPLPKPMLQNAAREDIQIPEEVIKKFAADFDHLSERCTQRIRVRQWLGRGRSDARYAHFGRVFHLHHGNVEESLTSLYKDVGRWPYIDLKHTQVGDGAKVFKDTTAYITKCILEGSTDVADMREKHSEFLQAVQDYMDNWDAIICRRLCL